MKKCSKVKNPCKICFQQVTPKTGLQCQGACRKWAHYNCLNYTPGKIQDIKAGIITVTCPCPDCKTSEPKEFLTDPPYSCTNQGCPANQLPHCQSIDCPSNRQLPPDCRPQPDPPPPCAPQPCLSVPCSPKPSNPCPPSPRSCVPKTCPSPPAQQHRPKQYSNPASNRPRPEPGNCLPKPPCGQRQAPKPQPPAQSQPRRRVSPKESKSCSFLSPSASELKKAVMSSSDSRLASSKEQERLLLCAIEQMCNTVGQLSMQIKELMCKMMETR